MSYDTEAMKDTRNVKGLIRALRRGQPPEQLEAAKALGSIGDKRATRSLAKALKYGDCSLPVAAAEALGTIGGRRTIRPLCKALKHPDSALNKAAAVALGMTGDPRAIGPLCEALAGGDRYGLVGAAAQALGKIRDPKLVGPLSEALRHVGPRAVMVIHTLTETDNEYALEALAVFTGNHPLPVCQRWLEEMKNRIVGGRREPRKESDAMTAFCPNDVSGCER